VLIDNTTIILRKVVVKEVIDPIFRVRWSITLDATYIHYRVASILCKIGIYDGWGIMGKQVVSPKVCPN
jgi:hypothetical protein